MTILDTYDSNTYLRLQVSMDVPIPYGALHWVTVAEYVIYLPQFSVWLIPRRNKRSNKHRKYMTDTEELNSTVSYMWSSSPVETY